MYSGKRQAVARARGDVTLNELKRTGTPYLEVYGNVLLAGEDLKGGYVESLSTGTRCALTPMS
jgi:hypothetical protein